MGKNYTIRITVEIIDGSGLHVGHGHRDIEDVPASHIGYKSFTALHGDFVRAYWMAREEFASRDQSLPKQHDWMPMIQEQLSEILNPMEQPLPFEDNCTLPGHDEHIHCEVHGDCMPGGTDCPKCMDLEVKGSQEQEGEFDDDVGADLDPWEQAANDQEPDIRSRMSRDPIAAHHADCQCTRCSQGDGAFLWLYHPEDY